MIRVTLDTNCIIDLEKDAQTARHIHTLMKMHEDGKITLRVVAISASERKRDGTYASNFAEFKNKMATLGLGSAEILKPLAHFDITHFDWCLFALKTWAKGNGLIDLTFEKRIDNARDLGNLGPHLAQNIDQAYAWGGTPKFNATQQEAWYALETCAEMIGF